MNASPDKPEYRIADIEILLKHHSDIKRLARVPTCELCNPLRNKTQTCRHPGFHYSYKILRDGILYLDKKTRKDTTNEREQEPRAN